MTDDSPRVLTRAELDALRKDMAESSRWAKDELQRRHENREETAQILESMKRLSEDENLRKEVGKKLV